MKSKNRNIIIVVAFFAFILTGAAFFTGQIPYQLICTEYSYDICTHKDTQYLTCYDTCYKDVEVCDEKSILGGQSKTDTHCGIEETYGYRYESGQYVYCNPSFTYRGESYDTIKCNTRIVDNNYQTTEYEFNPGGNLGTLGSNVIFAEVYYKINYCEDISYTECKSDGSMEVQGWNLLECQMLGSSCYCNFKKCSTEKESYECNPRDCNPTEVCTNWERKTGPQAPSGAKNVVCANQQETCGNGMCEPQHGENSDNCKADCYRNPCDGIVVDDGDQCTKDVCDQVTGRVTHTPIPGCGDPCLGINPDDGDECTIDKCDSLNGKATISHKEIQGCRSNYMDYLPYIIIGILALAFFIFMLKRGGKK